MTEPITSHFTKGNMARLVSMAVLVLLIVTLGLTFYRVMAPFLLPLFLAGVLAILCQPIYRYFLKRLDNKRYYAATATTSAILACVVIPTTVGITLGSLQLYTMSVNRLGSNSWSESLDSLRTLVDYHELAEWWYELSPTTLPVERRIRELKGKQEQEKADEEAEQKKNGLLGSPGEGKVDESSNGKSPNEKAPDTKPQDDTPSDSSDDAKSKSDAPETGNKPDSEPGREVIADSETPPDSTDADSDEAGKPDDEIANQTEADTTAETVAANVNTAEEIERLEAERKTRIAEEIKRREEEIRTGLQAAMFNTAQATITPGVALNTFNVISNLTWTLMGAFTFVIALYYFLADGPELVHKAESLIPVNIEHQRQLAEEFATAVRAVVMATMFAAGAQGLATSFALWLLGFGHFFVFTIVATIAALIPLAGTWLVWLPCAVWLAIQGEWFWSIALCLYGFLFVGMLDNVIRAYVLNSDAKLHPLLAFVSVLGGIQAMGLWGVFIAPIVASCLHALVQIFNSELVDMSNNVSLEDEQPSGESPKNSPSADDGVKLDTRTSDGPDANSSGTADASPASAPKNPKNKKNKK